MTTSQVHIKTAAESKLFKVLLVFSTNRLYRKNMRFVEEEIVSEDLGVARPCWLPCGNFPTWSAKAGPWGMPTEGRSVSRRLRIDARDWAPLGRVLKSRAFPDFVQVDLGKFVLGFVHLGWRF